MTLRRIMIVGGGIGGLTAAIGLRRAGFDVLVLEQSDQFGEVGAGVQLGPNAMRVLTRLGLGDQVRHSGVLPVAGRLFRWDDDRVLAGGPVSEVERRFGAPFCTMYRPDLIDLLAAHIPADMVRFGARVVGVDAGPGGSARVRLADGTVETGDLAVGADGAHSVMRAATVGDSPTRFSGCSAYRALLPGDRVSRADGPMIRFWLGPDRHVIAYHIGLHARYFNLVGVVPDPDACTELFSSTGDPAVLQAHFADWSDTVRELFGTLAGPVLRTPLHDRSPLPTWSTAVTTLLGDAAHPMLPFMAQGVGQAIEDAAALSHCLAATPDDLDLALSRYEAARLAHTTRVQRLAWDNNTTLHLPDGPRQQVRDLAMAQIDGGVTASLDWLYANDPHPGFDVGSLDGGQSIGRGSPT